MDVKNLTRAAIGQGLGMGWGDEAEAWLRTKLGDEEYEDALKRIRNEYGHFAKENPVSSGVAEFAGGALPGVAAMLVPGGQAAGAAQLGRSGLSAAARMAAAGAVTGAVTGAGSAEEGQRLAGAGSGAALGATLGVAIPAAVRGTGAAAGWLRDRLLPTAESTVASRAAQKMSNALAESGTAPREIAQTLQSDASRKIPSVVANADSGLADLAEAVAQRTGAGARKIEETLAAQRLGSKERAYQQVNKALQPGNYYDDLALLRKEMRERAEPLYQQAYSHGEVTDPEVLKFLKLPQFRQGLGEAQKLLAAEGRALDMSKPTVEVLDQVKRGIDGLIERETDAMTGKTTALGRVYVQKKNEFLDALDKAVPDYELARGVYKGGAELADAMRKGLKEFGSMPHEQVTKVVSEMSDAEKQAFKTGVARKLYDRIMTPSGNTNSAQSVIGAPEMQAKLQPLFDNPGEFKLFKAAMEREAQLFQQSNKILGGSQTGKRIQMRESLEDNSGIGEAIGHAVTGGWKQGLTGMVMGVLRAGQMTEKTAAKLADMLMAKDPHEVAAVVKLLEDYQVKAAPKALRASATQLGATTGAISAIHPAPADPATQIKGLSTIDEDARKNPKSSQLLIEQDLGE